jgi:hypothetical protein
MSIKNVIIDAAQSAKTFGLNIYQSMTVENARSAVKTAGATLTQWKGRYIELFKNNQNFAAAHCVVGNVAIFALSNKVANKIDSYFNAEMKYNKPNLYHAKNIALATLVGSATYGFNVLFSAKTGFKLSKQIIVISSVVAGLLRFNALTLKEFNKSSANTVQINKLVSDNRKSYEDNEKSYQTTIQTLESKGQTLINENNQMKKQLDSYKAKEEERSSYFS